MSQLFQIQSVDTTTINVPLAAVILSELQSGTTFLCTDGAAARTINLPSPGTAGLSYNFIMAVAPAQNLVFTCAGVALRGAAFGIHNAANPSMTASGANTKFTFVGGTDAIGDTISAISDGTRWQVRGISSVSAGIVFAA